MEKRVNMASLIRKLIPVLVLTCGAPWTLSLAEEKPASTNETGITGQGIENTEEGLVIYRKKVSDGSLVPSTYPGVSRSRSFGRTYTSSLPRARTLFPALPAPAAPPAHSGGRLSSSGQNRLLWERPDTFAICEDFDLTGNGDFALLSWSLNLCRWEFFETRTGTLLWTMDPIDHGLYPGWNDLEADISDDGSVIAVCVWGQDTSPPGEAKSILFKLDPLSGKPEWKYVFPYPMSQPLDVRVSSDGLKIVCLVQGDAASRPSQLYVFDSASSVPLAVVDLPFDFFNPPTGIDISDDAGRIAISMYRNIYILDGSGALLSVLDNSKTWQFAPALSPDGSLVVYGNFYGDLVLCKWSGNTYVKQWQYTIPPSSYYPWIVGLDIAGGRIMVGTNESDGFGGDGGRVRLFDVAAPTPLWISDDFGDMVEEVSLDASGKTGVAASWGPYPGTGNGWRTALFRTDSPDPLYAMDATDYAGSHFACEISKDGKFAVTGGKAVHALDWGHGGLTYCLAGWHDLEAEVNEISVTTGGAAELVLHAGQSNADRFYVAFCGNSGTQPGTPLPGGLAVLPLNADPFTYTAIGLLNTPRFVGFAGKLNTMGVGFARFDTLGPLPVWAVGRTLVCAFGLGNPCDFASNPVLIDIIP